MRANQSTQYGATDAWIARDDTVLVTRGEETLIQRAGQAPRTLPISGAHIVPSTTHPRALVGGEHSLTLVDWQHDVSITPIDLTERLLLPARFEDDIVFAASPGSDRVCRFRLAGSALLLEQTRELFWPAMLVPLAEGRLWVMTSSLGAAHYTVLAKTDLSVLEEGDLPSFPDLRFADKEILRNLGVGEKVDTSVRSDISKRMMLEWIPYSAHPPITTHAVYLLTSSVDEDNRLLGAATHYLSNGTGRWRYPLEHSLDVQICAHAAGPFIAVGTGTTESGRWELVSVETGELIGQRTRPLGDVPCVRICENQLIAAWADDSIDVVPLPGSQH